MCGPVAQLDRVPDFESEGQEFESLQGHQIILLSLHSRLLPFPTLPSN